jgi:hypothetical protein
MAQPLSPKLEWPLANPLWAQTLNPVIANPLNNVKIIQGYNLVSGINRINHGLGQLQQGWFLTDVNAAITVYRSSPFNNQTLTLTSSGAATVNIGVF